MKITDIRIRKVFEGEKLKAVASVTFDNEFVVHDIKIINGNEGLFIAMPSRKIGEARFADIAHPLNSEFRNELKKQILDAYEEA